MPNNLKFRSDNFTVVTPVGDIEHETPLLPDINDVLIFRQMQDAGRSRHLARLRTWQQNATAQPRRRGIDFVSCV